MGIERLTQAEAIANMADEPLEHEAKICRKDKKYTINGVSGNKMYCLLSGFQYCCHQDSDVNKSMYSQFECKKWSEE